MVYYLTIGILMQILVIKIKSESWLPQCHLFDAQYAHDAQSANAHYALYIIYVPKSCCAMSGSSVSACQWS